MAYGNLALDLMLKEHSRTSGRSKNGRYDNLPIEVVTATKRVVNVEEFYRIGTAPSVVRDFEMEPIFNHGQRVTWF